MHRPTVSTHGAHQNILFHPQPPAGGARGTNPRAHQPTAAPLRAGSLRLPRRRRLLGGALPAGTAGARARGASDESRRARPPDRDSPPREARHPALVPGQGELLGALGGGAGGRADHHHRLPQSNDGAALPAHRAVHVAPEPPHPGELRRRAPRARQLGRRASGQDPRHLQSPRRESFSSAHGGRTRRRPRRLGSPGRSARHRAAGAGRPAEASAGSSLGDARARPARPLAERRGGPLRRARARSRDQRALPPPGPRSAHRRLGALSRRGEGRSFALLGVGPLADALALRGPRQRRAGRVCGRAAGDPLARRQRRRDRPPRRKWLGDPHRASGRARARARRGAGHAGRAPP